ncbi:MAG: twin-arginine translocation signal domain-containing protein, partial [Phycisphaerales bacterium]
STDCEIGKGDADMKENISRRRFLLAAAGVGAATTLGGAEALISGCSRRVEASAPPVFSQRKLIVVLFGGGTRSSESIGDPTHSFIPHLWNEIIPRGTLFTNMRVEHKVVHPNSAGSIMTGHWEWDDIDWSRPVAHPTIFEIYRRARLMPDTSAWAFVYASILAGTGESLAWDYGKKYAANVVEPPTIPRTTAEQMDRQMQHAASLGSTDAQIEAANICAKLARAKSRISAKGLRSRQASVFLDTEYAKWKAGSGTTSHDAFLTDRAIACMHTFAPDVMAVDFGEIDCAHYGSWSRYVEAIRRTDELTWKLWQATEQMEQYRGRTLILILPDHGRELNRPGHWGFIHHSNFYTNEGADEGCRRVWMVALGPGVTSGRRIEKPIPITAVAATGLEFLGLEASVGAESSVWNLIT